MFRFNLISIICLILACSFSALAQSEGDSTSELEAVTTPTPQTKISSFNVSYMSWSEMVDLDSGLIADNTKHSNFFGLAIGYEKARFNRRWGNVLEGSVLFGQANIGENAGSIAYQKNYVKWTGVSGSYRLAYRVTSPLTVTIGPMILARQVKWPDAPANTDIKSGSDINFGLIADIQIRLSQKIDLKQTLGTLAFKASTYWSLGVGYRF